MHRHVEIIWANHVRDCVRYVAIDQYRAKQRGLRLNIVGKGIVRRMK
jgi:hypothetical protein